MLDKPFLIHRIQVSLLPNIRLSMLVHKKTKALETLRPCPPMLLKELRLLKSLLFLLQCLFSCKIPAWLYIKSHIINCWYIFSRFQTQSFLIFVRDNCLAIIFPPLKCPFLRLPLWIRFTFDSNGVPFLSDIYHAKSITQFDPFKNWRLSYIKQGVISPMLQRFLHYFEPIFPERLFLF